MPQSQTNLRNNIINYQEIAERYTWSTQRNQNIILSPDSDGFLCGLLYSHFLNWKIVGYYDGKALLLKNGLRAEQCVFLDVEIFRSNIKSVGHHMVLYNKRYVPPNWNNFSNCIQLNNLRNFDYKNDFERKYPFGTIHFLLGLLQNRGIITSLTDNSLYPLLFCDGVWNNLFGYTENCLDWIDYLGINQPTHILNNIFCSNHSFYAIMNGMNDFLRFRDSFNATGFFDGTNFILRASSRSGHNMRISNNRGNIINLVRNGSLLDIHTNEKNRVEGFIRKLATDTGWTYNNSNWIWSGFKVYTFPKSDFESEELNLNNGNYQNVIQQNPISWAIGKAGGMEYTLETPNRLP